MTGLFVPPEQRDGDLGVSARAVLLRIPAGSSITPGCVPLEPLGPSLGTPQAEPEVQKLLWADPTDEQDADLIRRMGLLVFIKEQIPFSFPHPCMAARFVFPFLLASYKPSSTFS